MIVKNILVICGGGMKGLPAAAVLDELRLLVNGHVSRHVDLIAGTSIGGILAGLVAAEVPGRLTDFFTEDGATIFRKSIFRHWPLYAAAPIEAVLKSRFAGATLKNCKTRLLVTALDRKAQQPFFFKSYDTGNQVLDGATPLWQVGRATSAAQRYFPAFKHGQHILWDGGNIANNPAVCAYAEACKLWPGERVKMLVLGCGEDVVPAPRWPQWLQDLVLTIGLQFDTSQEEVDYQMQQFIGDDYRVLQPTFDRPVALDGADTASLAWLKAASERMVIDSRPSLDWFLA
jgi:hypothetical protein